MEPLKGGTSKADKGWVNCSVRKACCPWRRWWRQDPRLVRRRPLPLQGQEDQDPCRENLVDRNTQSAMSKHIYLHYSWNIGDFVWKPCVEYIFMDSPTFLGHIRGEKNIQLKHQLTSKHVPQLKKNHTRLKTAKSIFCPKRKSLTVIWKTKIFPHLWPLPSPKRPCKI